MSMFGSSAKIETEGATIAEAEEAGLQDNLTPRQLQDAFEEGVQHLNSSETFSGYPTCMDQCNNKTTIKSSSCALKEPTDKSPSSSNMVFVNQSDSSCKSKRKRPSRSMQQVIAERNQSVELSHQFTALKAIVPGTEEEMDETIVLGASIKYMKQLQEKLETLEEKGYSDSEICTSDHENVTDEPQLLPEIEARVSHRNVLIRIQCELCKGILVKALDETEKLHLSVVHTSAIPFGDSTLDITITAEMEDEFVMTLENLVKSLRSSLIQFTAKNIPQEHDN